jgi:hypothetical protein
MIDKANFVSYPCQIHKYSTITGLCQRCGNKSTLTPAQLQQIARKQPKVTPASRNVSRWVERTD